MWYTTIYEKARTLHIKKSINHQRNIALHVDEPNLRKPWLSLQHERDT